LPTKRKSSFGNLRTLPSGRIQARYTAPDGKTYTAPVTFTTATDAGTWLTTIRADIVRELWRPPKKLGDETTFGDYSRRWLADRDLKPRTRAHYQSLLDNHIDPTFEKLPIGSITPSAVRAWHADLAVGHPTLRSHAYSLLRSILGTAVGDELLDANPCHIRGAGNVKRAVKIRPASLPELEALVEAMPAKYKLGVLLSAWCGLRFGELTELRRKDVDVKAGVLRIRRAVAWVGSRPVVGKPKSEAGIRDIAVPPHLLPAIKAHLRDHVQPEPGALLFPSPTGGNLATSTLYKSYWPARKKAGRPDLRWHDLRHTSSVLAASTGATLAELMARLGHSTPGAALRYMHAAKGRDTEIAAALSALVTGATT
jgi:integrase